MTSALELRYRRLLGWYPKSWRTQHEDAFVGTLLDVAEAEDRQHPTRQEKTSIISHGMAARVDRAIVRNVRDAGSTIALTAGTGIAFTEFVVSSWAPWLPGNPAPGWLEQVGPFYDTGFVFAGLWVIALVAAIAGRWALGRIALILSIAAAILSPQLFQQWPGVLSVDRATLALLGSSALIAILGRPHRGVATTGAAIGWGLLAVLAYVSPSIPYGYWASSRSLWGDVGMFWYGALLVILVAVGLAIARLWTASFIVVLGLTPLAITFTANELEGIVIQDGWAAAVSVPVGIGLVLLALHSSGRVTLSTHRSPRHVTFEPLLAVVLIAGGFLAAESMTRGSENAPLSLAPVSHEKGKGSPSAFAVPGVNQHSVATTKSFKDLVASGHLTSIDLDRRTGDVTSFSTHGEPASTTKQQALDAALSAPGLEQSLFRYLPLHSTTVTIDAATGAIERVAFTPK